MQITQSIDLNLSIDGIPPQLHMPQGDGGRIISASLWDGATIYSPPDGTMCMLRFRKPDGTGGLYDTAEDGTKINLANNVATIPVALQVLAVGGPVHCQVELYAPAAEGELLSANRLATFEFEILVSPSVYPDAEVISGDYVNIISKQLEILASKAEANANAAAGSATNAAASATSAGKSASEASEKASDAANSASAAATSAQTAKSAASAAADAASMASTAAEAASGSASRAQESAAAAAKSAASVDGINKTAQSWAVGGTGTREGEDTNNAKYWAEQAQQAAGGGVVSFNGRAGSVVPQAGDYDKDMVGLGNVDNTSDADKPVSIKQQKALDGKQAKITASGILKSDGSGGVTAAKAGTDYATPDSLPEPSDTAPVMDGTAEAGTLATYARGDHKHPADTSKQAKITARGLLKGDGAGGVTAAAAGTDYSGPKVTVTATLLASGWTGSEAPFVYTLAIAGVTATSYQELLPAVNITAEQLKALQAANITDGGQAADSMTLKAYGKKPAVDIPIRVIKEGE